LIHARWPTRPRREHCHRSSTGARPAGEKARHHLRWLRERSGSSCSCLCSGLAPGPHKLLELGQGPTSRSANLHARRDQSTIREAVNRSRAELQHFAHPLDIHQKGNGALAGDACRDIRERFQAAPPSRGERVRLRFRSRSWFDRGNRISAAMYATADSVKTRALPARVAGVMPRDRIMYSILWMG
jgi:hypothetical protein